MLVASKVDTPLLKRLKPLQWLMIFAAIFVLILVAGWIASPALSRSVHTRMVAALEKDFDSEVSLKNLTVSIFPAARITGEGLVLRRHGRQDLPPLITIAKFSARANLWGLIGSTVHISEVRLEGLRIEVPPRGSNRDEKSANETEVAKKQKQDFVIDTIVADGTLLRTLPKLSWKDPLEYDIRFLRLHGAGNLQPMTFEATLRNAKPPGDIRSKGQFGPWNREEPGDTPVSGSYEFRNADLAVFKGISGILSSDGSYKGALARIEVDGKTDTPDFTVKVGGNPVHLTTEFHAIVDGTDGDTLLQPVVGHFGKSTVTARGGVVGTRGVKGKTVTLDATVMEGRVEDMLRLAVHSNQPLLIGAIGFKTKIIIPPGDVDVAQKLKLDGAFELRDARFSKLNIQEKVNQLSKRAQGDTSESETGEVASDFAGSFQMDAGVMNFQKLSFRVPGAQISLNGKYGLADKSIDFRGTARLEAKLSQTTTGFKSFLLKALDPFFKKNGAGAEIPIKIQGTKDEPTFGLALGPGKK